MSGILARIDRHQHTIVCENILRTQSAPLRPFYDARVSDLGPGEFVQIECVCGHTELLTGAMLATAGLQPYDVIKDLTRRLRGRECDEKGRVDISIKWAIQ